MSPIPISASVTIAQTVHELLVFIDFYLHFTYLHNNFPFRWAVRRRLPALHSDQSVCRLTQLSLSSDRHVMH